MYFLYSDEEKGFEDIIKAPNLKVALNQLKSSLRNTLDREWANRVIKRLNENPQFIVALSVKEMQTIVTNYRNL